MTFHVAAYVSAAFSNTAFTAISSITDSVLSQNSSSNGYQVPANLSYLSAFYGNGADATAFQFQSPSLLKRFGSYQNEEPFDVTSGAVIQTPPPVHDYFDKPIELAAAETLQLYGTTSASSTINGLAFLSSGPAAMNPIPANAEIITIKGTSSTTLTANAWTACTLTLAQQLQAGTYGIVGMRAQSTHALAGRLAAGLSGTGGYRPGCIGSNTVSAMDNPRFRYGRAGVWGYFNNQTIPQVEFFSGTADTSETVFLDVFLAQPA